MPPQAALEAGEPLLLELGRHLGAEASQLADPAWAAHHALLAFECADALQEAASCCAAGAAAPLGAFGGVAPASMVSALPPYVPPAG